jgi:ectoine hydroxylase-related dioxygenase (phytanoyl-CoA dioxygenase family)
MPSPALGRPMTHFSREEIAGFERDGFIVVRGLFGASEMARISNWSDEIESRPDVPGTTMKYFENSLIEPGKKIINRIENFYPYHEGFRALFDDPRILGRLAELFGEPAVLFKDKINFKYPGGDGFKHHQDQAAGWWTYADLFISALISIDDSTPENGCLEIAPGDAKHRTLDREWRPFTADEIKRMPFVQIPTKPGDVILFDSFVPHGSYPNLSNERRRILYITYNRASGGDHRAKYFADKRKSYPPDSEREPGKEYVYRV